MPRRHHYHDYLKNLVENSCDEKLKAEFYEIEKAIDEGKFYPIRIEKVRENISKRVQEGKSPLSGKGLMSVIDESQESNLVKKLKK